MKITLNLYQPNFKAIQLNDDEKKQVSSNLRALRNEDISDFQRNILKSDIMDVFIPHIQKEAEASDDPKTTKFDLNMKMFDALNSFADKKNPLGWILATLNGTQYRDPKPTIEELLDEDSYTPKTEREVKLIEAIKRAQEDFARPKVDNTPTTPYFDYDIESQRIYTMSEIKGRARKLNEYFGRQYKFKEMLNIVEQNKYLIEYSNNQVDQYITRFAEELEFGKDAVLIGIANHPEILRYTPEQFKRQTKKLSKLTGCREEVCKNVLLGRPQILDENLDEKKEDVGALRFYKIVRGKNHIQDVSLLTAPNATVSHMKTLTFLIAVADKKKFNMAQCKQDTIFQYLTAQDGKTYKFILPDCDELTDDFMEYAINLSNKKLGKNIFDFDIISQEEYKKILKPASFIKFAE